MTPTEKALLLWAEIKASLADGTRHYDAAGRLLDTPEKVFKVLVNKRKLILKSREATR
jgi:hypothetical protein